MCYNIIEGRHHQGCDCFEAMGTTRHDCGMANCVFSAAHPPVKACPTHHLCNKYMTLPAKKAIRSSPYKCAPCAARIRESERILVQA
ncbi:hypothetical protein FRC00_008917 [Tulasnella sp. 408]|nr:hypothetical protein FRC00_008917 [Tulasnella sp. 408]